MPVIFGCVLVTLIIAALVVALQKSSKPPIDNSNPDENDDTSTPSVYVNVGKDLFAPDSKIAQILNGTRQVPDFGSLTPAEVFYLVPIYPVEIQPALEVLRDGNTSAVTIFSQLLLDAVRRNRYFTANVEDDDPLAIVLSAPFALRSGPTTPPAGEQLTYMGFYSAAHELGGIYAPSTDLQTTWVSYSFYHGDTVFATQTNMSLTLNNTIPALCNDDLSTIDVRRDASGIVKSASDLSTAFMSWTLDRGTLRGLAVFAYGKRFAIGESSNELADNQIYYPAGSNTVRYFTATGPISKVDIGNGRHFLTIQNTEKRTIGILFAYGRDAAPTIMWQLTLNSDNQALVTNGPSPTIAPGFAFVNPRVYNVT